MSTRTTRHHKKPAANTHTAFSEHVAELRSRVFWIVAAFVVASSLAYSFRDRLIDIVMSPLGSQKLIYLTPGGGFSFIFQVTMYAGAVVTAPLIVFHLYRFIRPALPLRAQRNSFYVILSSTLLMFGGMLFGYIVAIPSALAFLTTFAGDFVSSSLTAESYISFVVAYLAGLGILFQLPLFLIIWNWISPIKSGGLLSSQRFLVAFAFIAAAVITPTPDLINQSLIALPIIGIYQLGAITVFIVNRRARKALKQQATPVTPNSPVSPSLPESPAPNRTPAPAPLALGASVRPPQKQFVMDVVSRGTKMPSLPAVRHDLQPSRAPRVTPPVARRVPTGSIDGFRQQRPTETRIASFPSTSPVRRSMPVRSNDMTPPSRTTAFPSFYVSPR